MAAQEELDLLPYPDPSVGEVTMPYPPTPAETLLNPDQASVVDAILKDTASIVLYQRGQKPVSIDIHSRRYRLGSEDDPPESALLLRWADKMVDPIQAVATQFPKSIGGERHLLDVRAVSSRDAQVACTFVDGKGPPTYLLLGMPRLIASAFSGMVRVDPMAYKTVVSAELQRLGQDPEAWESGYPSDGVAVAWRSVDDTSGWDGVLQRLKVGIAPGQEGSVRKQIERSTTPLDYGKHPVQRPGSEGYSDIENYYEVSESHSVREGVSPANIERVEAIAQTDIVGLGVYCKSPTGTMLRSSKGDLKLIDDEPDHGAFYARFVTENGERRWESLFVDIGMDTVLDYLKAIDKNSPDGYGLAPQDNHVLIRDDRTNTLIVAAKSDQFVPSESRGRSWQVVGVQLKQEAYRDMIRMITEERQPNSLRLLLFEGVYELFKLQSYDGYHGNPGIETLPTDSLSVTTTDDIKHMYQLWEAYQVGLGVRPYQDPTWPQLDKIGYPQGQRLLISRSSRDTRL